MLALTKIWNSVITLNNLKATFINNDFDNNLQIVYDVPRDQTVIESRYKASTKIMIK